MKAPSKSLITFIVSSVGFVLFALGVKPFPYAGQSAYILAGHLGVDPFVSFANPVYSWIIKAIGLVTGSHAVYFVNLFSAFCAAAVLGLVFAFVYRATRSFNADNAFSARKIHRIQIAAGLASVLYLLASAPFWMAGTRANPIAFDLLLLLASFYFVISFSGTTGPSRILLACLLYGITIVEFSTAILIAPFFGILVIIRLSATGVMRFKLFLQCIGCGLVGLSLYLVQAALFTTTTAYEWREFTGFFQVIWYIWLEQYSWLTGGLPRVGWMTLALVTFVPWVITAFFRIPTGPSRARGAMVGTGALNLILLALAAVMLRDVPLAPENITGTARLYVTPYLLIALWFGNVMAFWIVLAFRNKRFESAGMKKFRRAGGYALTVATPVFLVFVMVSDAVPRALHPAQRLSYDFVKAIVDQAADKEWLLTNTPFDEQIGLEIRRRELPLKLFRMSYGRSPATMKHVASLFADEPRLASLAQIGMEPLIDQWFSTVPDADQKMAVVTMPDIWQASGYEAIPRLVLYDGLAPGAVPPIDEIHQEALDFWSGYGAQVVAFEGDRHGDSLLIDAIRIHLAKMANNLGVLLEDQGRIDDAFAAYQQARRFFPDNLSALMNMHVLSHREGRPEYEALEAELMERVEKLGGRLHTVSLSHLHGYVRVPELFANRGMSFAMSGKANIAIRDMKRALSLREGNPQLQLALAGLYMSQDQDTESRENYEAVLANQPGNPNALLGLLRLSVRQQDYEEGRRYLALMRDVGVQEQVLKMEEAFIEALSGNTGRSLEIMNELVRLNPGNTRAWSVLAVLALEAGDMETGERAMKRLRDAQVFAPGIQLIMAQSALSQNDRDGARRHLREILVRQPSNIPALEMLLRIDLSEGNRDAVQRTAERILNVDRRNALANYMLGVHHYYNEEFALAESAYRVSLETRRSGEALNDLAYVLFLQGRHAEAEPLVREAIEVNPRNSAAWDTLGSVLMEQGKQDEARDAFLQSLALRPGTAGVILSLAVLNERTGRSEEALRMARELSARLNELSPQAQIRHRELMQRLGERR